MINWYNSVQISWFLWLVESTLLAWHDKADKAVAEGDPLKDTIYYGISVSPDLQSQKFSLPTNLLLTHQFKSSKVTLNQHTIQVFPRKFN